MRKIELKIRYFFWAFFESLKAHPNYKAIYNGKEYFLKNEIYDPKYWTLIDEKGNKIRAVHIKNFKIKIVDFKRFKQTFLEKYKFQMWSWFAIDATRKFGSRIGYKNSSDIVFPKN